MVPSLLMLNYFCMLYNYFVFCICAAIVQVPSDHQIRSSFSTSHSSSSLAAPVKIIQCPFNGRTASRFWQVYEGTNQPPNPAHRISHSLVSVCSWAHFQTVQQGSVYGWIWRTTSNSLPMFLCQILQSSMPSLLCQLLERWHGSLRCQSRWQALGSSSSYSFLHTICLHHTVHIEHHCAGYSLRYVATAVQQRHVSMHNHCLNSCRLASGRISGSYQVAWCCWIAGKLVSNCSFLSFETVTAYALGL